MSFEVVKKRIDLCKAECSRWEESIRKHSIVYDEMKCARVYELCPNIYSFYIRCTSNMGGNWLHLIIGDEKNLLIDTGYGVGNLKGLVERISGNFNKELVVVNTHCHGDHCLGNGQFKRVFIHEYDAPALYSQMTPEFFYDFNHLDSNSPEKELLMKQKIIPFDTYEVMPCSNHFCFKLGADHEVVLLHTGGHTAGSSVFLDKKNRILFSGDSILPWINGAKGPTVEYFDPEFNPEQCTLMTYNKGLNDIAKHAHCFDAIFPAHGMLGLKKEILFELLETTTSILLNPNSYDTTGIKYKMECCFKFTDSTTVYYTMNSLY